MFDDFWQFLAFLINLCLFVLDFWKAIQGCVSLLSGVSSCQEQPIGNSFLKLQLTKTRTEAPSFEKARTSRKALPEALKEWLMVDGLCGHGLFGCEGSAKKPI